MITSRLFKKTLFAVLGIFIFIVALSSLFSIRVLRQQMVDEYFSKARSIVTSISMSVPDVFLEQDAAAIQSIIDQYMQVEGVGYVLALDQHERVIAHTFSPEIPSEIAFHHALEAPDIAEDHRWITIGDEQYLDVSGPILLGKGGFIHIGMKMSVVNRNITSALVRIQLFNLGVFLLCMLAVYYFMQKISQPLVQLTNYAQRLRNRDLDFSISIESKDEIGELASTMEGMREELSRYVHKLKQAVRDATDELQQVLIYLSSIMDNMADGLVVLDEEGRIIRYNISFKEIFEIKAHNLIEQSVSNYIEMDLISHYHKSPGGNHQRLEFACVTPQKGRIHIEASISMISMTCGINYIVILHDITDRIKMEEELKSLYADLEKKVTERTNELVVANENLNQEINLRKKAEIYLQSEKEFFAVTLKSIGDAVVITDKNGRLVFTNRVAEEILAVDHEDSHNLHFKDVFSIKDSFGNLLNPFEKVMTTRKIVKKSRGATLVSHSGKTYSVSFIISPIYDRQSQILGTVMVFQDISHILHLEEERLRKEKLESIGLLAGGIAHDFNNILTAILNHIILVKSNLDSADNNIPKLESAQKACLRARRLTQQLLTFSKGGAPIKEETSMSELIEDTVAFALRGSKVVSSLDIYPNLWPANVDPGQISQVLENLVINAAQSMPTGGNIWIRANNMTLEEDDDLPLQPGKYLQISIRDDGCGIDPECLKKIFDPYYTTKADGTGLGLATSYSIIKNHSGHIEVRSEPKNGTEFTVYLPAMTGQIMRQNGPEEPVRLKGGGKVLVLDDDQEILEVVSEVLNLLGYEACLVSEGREALEAYKSATQAGEPFDLAILDLTVPGGMGGLETMRKLMEMDPDIKAVVSSGYSQDPVMADYREHGFAGVLAKPYTIDELSAVLNKLLNNN